MSGWYYSIVHPSRSDILRIHIAHVVNILYAYRGSLDDASLNFHDQLICNSTNNKIEIQYQTNILTLFEMNKHSHISVSQLQTKSNIHLVRYTYSAIDPAILASLVKAAILDWDKSAPIDPGTSSNTASVS